MELNWTIEVISTFIAGSIVFITSIFTFRSRKVSKIRSIIYLRLAWNCITLFYFFEGLSYLYLNISLARISASIMILALILLIFSINYTTKETIFSKIIIIVIGISTLYFYLLFQPQSFMISYESGFYTIVWGGLFVILAAIIQIIMVCYLLIWGYRSWKHAPFLIKREASIFFLGTFLASVCLIILYLLHFFSYLFIIAMNLSLSLGCLILSIALIKQPKILYILPFTLFRISVKDREGNPLFDHDWSESKVNELVFTGFINAVQLMSHEIIKMGGLLDIQLQEGIVILHESKKLTVGLVSSKSSKAVRESLVKFTKDFEELFQKQLKQKDTNMKGYELAYVLVEKHFSNFPSRLIRSDRQPLLLSPKYLEIPQVLENKLKTLFPDELEYERIKAELIRAPLFTSEDFLDLYDELKDEIEKLENQEKRSGSQ